MQNAIQWLYIVVGALGIILPLIIVGIARPWRRNGPGWTWIHWGLAAGVGLLVGSFMLALTLGSAGDLRRTRAALINDLLTAAFHAFGPAPAVALVLLIVGTTSVVTFRITRPRPLPADIDLAGLRVLSRKGATVDDLQARYLPSARFSSDEFVLAVALGQADRKAKIFYGRVITYAPRSLRTNRALFRYAAALESKVHTSNTLDDTKHPLSELAALARRVEAGEPIPRLPDTA
ncbi:hypothetical protein [Microbacterium rhizomatis]|uniref:Uncharacterized protein n=1 Tax=Microbacterium rhizomatis TaxID=1631477 RepID=A0A5J5J080_9MICO|nr:hypothetical protein [Microbacterium rhizomatis]KAA9107935.1 hypothetical protein F6B43_10950 [Microbacterium rhizomatis]